MNGLRGALGRLNFDSIRQRMDTIVTVTDAAIITAMRLLWTRL